MSVRRALVRNLLPVDGLWRDVRYGVRMLARNPGFTIVAVLTLAVGIGVNATVFTVTNAVLFKGFPLVQGNDRLLYLDTLKDGRGCCVSYPDFEQWRAQATAFEGMGAVADLGIALSDTRGFSEMEHASQISAGTFRLLRQQPIVGRDFAATDETPGAAPVAILSYGFWERRYGKDPSIVGQTITINGAPTTVIGVMPRGFSFPQNQDLWLPLVPTPEFRSRSRGLWFAFGRMAAGVTVERARAEMETIGRRLAVAEPRTNQGVVPVVRTFQQFFFGRNAALIYGSMWAAVGLVLLIACANLANLLLVRANGRSRETAVRMALGAGRWPIVRQLLVESLLLSAMAGVAGWWIAEFGVRAYETAANPDALSWSAHLVDYTMENRAFVYLMAISVGSGLLLGLAPAFRLTTVDLNATLKQGGRGAVGKSGSRLSAVLVGGEVALTVVLLAGAGVLIRSFLKIYRADLGVETGNVLTALLNLPDARYPRSEAQMAFYDDLAARLEAIPGVESIAMTDYLPTWGARRLPYELVGGAALDAHNRPTLSALVVGPGYFRTMGTAVVSGRDFGEEDDASEDLVAIVNQRFASQSWPGESALGKRVRLFEGTNADAWRTVVGVAPNIVQNDATRQDVDPIVYLPYGQHVRRSMWIVVRTRVPPASLATAFRREVQSLDPGLPIWLGPITLAERLEGIYWARGLYGALFVVFAAIALLLASVGIHAVVAQSVSRRTHEIGVRIAIGASARDILTLVCVQGMLPLGIGLAIGLAASLAINPILKSQLVQVSPADPVTYLIASSVLVLSAALGCVIPACRAMRVDPLVALRHQ